MRILENFLEEECDYWLNYCKNHATVPGYIFDPRGTELYKEVKRLIPLPLINTYLYCLEPNAEPNPHLDSQQYAVTYYPADSDGRLGFYDQKWKLFDSIGVKRNRLVLFECAAIIHSQIPPTQGTRYSVVFKFKLGKGEIWTPSIRLPSSSQSSDSLVAVEPL